MDRLEEKKHTRRFEPIQRRGTRSGGFSFARFLYWLSLLIFIGAIIYILFFSQFLAVSEIKLDGLSRVDNQALESFIADQLAGKYFELIPKNNLILIGKKNISQVILDKFKLIEDVRIKKIFPNVLSISIAERDPQLILCSRGNCFVIDERGVAFAEADPDANQLGENDLFTLRNDGDKEITAGSEILDPSYLKYLADIREKLKNDIGVDIEREMKTPQLVSGDIRVTTQEGWLVYFDKNIPIPKEIEMLKVVLSEKIPQDQRNNLEYIDLRTDNKVYYKLKNIETVENSDQKPETQKTEPDKNGSAKKKK